MLQNWLKPVPTGLLTAGEKDPFFFSRRLALYSKRFPGMKRVKAALLGAGGSETQDVRQALYKMSYPWRTRAVADLGDLQRPTQEFLLPVLKELIDGGIVPVIFGAQATLLSGQFKAYRSLPYPINVALVDARPRLDPGNKRGAGNRHSLLKAPASQLFHTMVLGSQAHITFPEEVGLMEERHCESVRLGALRARLQEAEPLIRYADMVSFHLDALCGSDAPGQATLSPSGLHTEEACQLCRYAGLNDKLTSFSVLGFSAGEPVTAQSVAQMLWYFLDGVLARNGDYPESEDGLTEYVIDLKDPDYHISFWKSTSSGRWWMQAPVKCRKQLRRHTMIPCSYSDYLEMSKGNFPDRLWKLLQLFE